MRKNCKNRHYTIIDLGKLVMSFYVLIFIFSSVTSDTMAYFTSNTQVNGAIQIGEWEVEKGDNETFIPLKDGQKQATPSCPRTVEINIIHQRENKSVDQITYELYFSRQNVSEDQMKRVEPATEKEMDFFDAGDQTQVRFTAKTAGYYQIALFSGAHEKISVSESIKVDCHEEENTEKLEGE